MDHKADWESVAARLRRAGNLEVTQFEVGEPATGEDLEAIKLMEYTPPPPPISNSTCRATA